jgi:hypothetical protein
MHHLISSLEIRNYTDFVINAVLYSTNSSPRSRQQFGGFFVIISQVSWLGSEYVQESAENADFPEVESEPGFVTTEDSI